MGLLDWIDQKLGTRLNLLASDPSGAMQQMNQQAGAYNQASLLATQAERNALRGLPVTLEQAAAKQYVDKTTEDLAMGFAGSTIGKVNYPQAEALQLAQQRAALPKNKGGLGLPADNTAMDRAKAMGFDFNTTRFHGSDQDIYAFDPAKFGKSDQGWYGRGVTTDTDPEIASAYANYNESPSGQVVYPLVSRGKYMQWPEGQQPFSTARDLITLLAQILCQIFRRPDINWLPFVRRTGNAEPRTDRRREQPLARKPCVEKKMIVQPMTWSDLITRMHFHDAQAPAIGITLHEQNPEMMPTPNGDFVLHDVPVSKEIHINLRVRGKQRPARQHISSFGLVHNNCKRAGKVKRRCIRRAV